MSKFYSGTEDDVTLFERTDSGALQEAMKLAEEWRKSMEKCFDTIKCVICGKYIANEAGMIEHAKLTGHKKYDVDKV